MRREAASNVESLRISQEAGGRLPSAAGAERPVPKPNRLRPRYRTGCRAPERSNRQDRFKRPSEFDREWKVVDNLPDAIPVTKSEIEVIETYLAGWETRSED